MIIEKAEMTRDEKRELDDLIDKYQSMDRDSDEAARCFQEMLARHEDIKHKSYRRYILSFSGRKEEVLMDVREILAAVERSDFEAEQDRRRAILWGSNGTDEIDKGVDSLLKKNFKNCMMFLLHITSAQASVIQYDPNQPFITNTGEDPERIQSAKSLSDSDSQLYDRYFDLLIEKASSFYRMPKDFSSSGLYSSFSVEYGGSIILQNKAINAFSHISNRSFQRTDSFSKKGTAVQEDVEITIDDMGDNKFNVSTQKVKDLMLEHLAQQLPRGMTVSTDSIAASREVTLSVKEVAERFQTGMKEARQMLNEAVTALYNASVKWRERSYYTEDGRRRKFPEIMEYEHRYLSGIGRTPDETPVVKGKATVLFDYDFAILLSRSGYVMFYHPNLYHINSNINRHSYYLGRKMCEHYNAIVRDYDAQTPEDTGKVVTKHANRISVRNLIKVCPDLPNYEEVMESDRAVRRRIIDPFEKDMYALCERYSILTTWRYCNKKGEPLSDEQWKDLNYHDWVELYIEFEIADYPDQTKRLERKAARIKGAQ